MRIPAVAIAAAFAGGILLGRGLQVSRSVLGISFLVISFLLITALLFAWRAKVWAAASCSLLGWVCLGAVGMSVAARRLPAEHILSRIAAGEIALKTPLRWYGHLRGEPTRLPWGIGMEMELSGVETAAGMTPVSGGMRIGFTPKEGEALPEVHAGDEVSVMAQARLPLVFRDEGAFDRREYLARQNIHLLATLRGSSLLERISEPPATMETRLAGVQAWLRERLDGLYLDAPQTAGILRAMLLGDRSFVDRAESVDFQKTGVYHVLVVAGLHVGALAFFLYWLGNKLRLPRTLATVLLLAALFAYIAVVEQRAPVLRAGLMTGIVVLAGFFYRRLEILNSAALAAMVLLVAKPAELFDTSFQLSFLAIGCIAGVAVPWMERQVQPFIGALQGWRDVTRDGAFAARQAQFRLDLRAVAAAMTVRLPARAAKLAQDFGVKGFGWGLRGVEMFALSMVLQFGMLPLMARDFHRVTLMGPVANLFAVPLTGVIVPLGFFTLGSAVMAPPVAWVLAVPLGWLVWMQGHVVGWFAGFAHGSYRIPGPPVWVTVLFFVCGIALAAGWAGGTRVGWRWKWGAAGGWMLSSLGGGTNPFPAVVERGALEVDVLDVAQGDSILVISPKGSTLLIDGGGRFAGFRGREEVPGPGPGEVGVARSFGSGGIRKLDAVASP